MDVHLGVQSARDPEEVGEVADLPIQFLGVGGAIGQDSAGLHPKGPNELDWPQLAVADPLDELLPVPGMAGHEAGGDLEILFFRRLARLDDPSHARRVAREGLFHEDVHALLDCVLQLHRAESGVAGEHRNIARTQAVDRLAVRIEAHEPPILRHVHPIGVLRAQALVGVGQTICIQVGHGDQPDRSAGGLARIGHGPASATAATDQRQADRVVLGGMDLGDCRSGQCGACGDASRLGQEVAARQVARFRGGRLRLSFHEQVSLRVMAVYSLLPIAGAGQFRCLCRNWKVPTPWISWPPLKNSISVRSPRPSVS